MHRCLFIEKRAKKLDAATAVAGASRQTTGKAKRPGTAQPCLAARQLLGTAKIHSFQTLCFHLKVIKVNFLICTLISWADFSFFLALREANKKGKIACMLSYLLGKIVMKRHLKIMRLCWD